MGAQASNSEGRKTCEDNCAKICGRRMVEKPPLRWSDSFGIAMCDFGNERDDGAGTAGQ